MGSWKTRRCVPAKPKLRTVAELQAALAKAGKARALHEQTTARKALEVLFFLLSVYLDS